MSRALVRIHPSAFEEAQAAMEWYRQRSLRAAEMFLAELDHAVERIGDQPGQFPEYVSGTRRVVLDRFPYFIVFRETPEGMEILAVAHGRRRPGYWRDRVE